MLPNARFNELLTDIEPSPTTKDEASRAHKAVRNHLRSHPDFGHRVTGDFLAGSYIRDTAIRPRKTSEGIERPDVDIIVVTNFENTDAPDAVLQELADALEDNFTVERINKRSVRVLTSKAEIDVVPVRELNAWYELPDRDLDRWKPTNPPRHITWSGEQNDAFEGRFKPLVKMLKWWRRENKSGKRPKGFILEVLVAKHAPRTESHWGEAFAQTLEGIYDAYGTLAERGLKPFIEDPAIPGNDIMTKVSITDWKNFIERVRVHASYARRAQTEDDVDEASRLWRNVFGERFRGTPKVAKAVGLGTVAAVAPAATGYAFPNQSAAPKTPRGFA